jgi:hypothetical protein
MPTFKFTSPEGTEFYGEGADQAEAFRSAKEMSPGEVAAMRTRQAARPSGGRGESEFTGELENMMVPGLGAVKSAMGGDYPGAAKEAATSAAGWLAGPIASRIPTALKAGGTMAATLFAPTAAATESAFPFISDPTERQSADARYSKIKVMQKDPKTGREYLDKNATAKARDDFMAEQQTLARSRAENLAEQKDFDERVRPGLEKLSPEEKQIYETITVPGNPGQTRAQKAAFLQAAEEHRQQLKMTWAEKHPDYMEDLQWGAAGLSTLAPIYQNWRRALGLNRTAKDAEEAFIKATKARAPKDAKEALAWRTKLAEEMDAIDDPSFLKAMAKSALIGGLVSSAATQAPNFVDWARQPPGEARDKARAAALDPEAYGRSVLEGGIGAGAGKGLSEKFGMLPTAKARNQAIIKTVREREAAAAEKAKALAEGKQKAALAKALKAGAGRPGAGSALKPQSPLSPQSQLDMLTSGGA